MGISLPSIRLPRLITASFISQSNARDFAGTGLKRHRTPVMEEETPPIPNVRAKLDELFLHWLSKATTQEFLQQELKRVLSREEKPKTVVSLSSGAPSTPAEPLTPSPPPPDHLHCGASPSPPPVQSFRSQSSKKKRNYQLTLSSTKQVLTDANEQTVHDSDKTDDSSSSSSGGAIPPFYFPFGRPEASAESHDRVLKEAHKKFKGYGREGVRREEFGTIVKVSQ